MTLDNAMVEIMNNRFVAIVEEMGFTILRTGHTVFIKETGDFGTALVTPAGEVFAAPLRIGMIRTLGMPMEGCVASMDRIREGDIWIANDPESTGGMSTHLPDVFLWKPIIAGGKLVCFVWCFIHVSDIGGRVPGSIAPLSSDIFQEGLRIPPSCLYRRGVLNRDLRDLILANSRIPEDTWGDLQAALAALYRGEQRMRALVQRYGVTMVKEASTAVLDYAEKRARLLFDLLPEGEYSFRDYLEGGSMAGRPICIRVRLKVRASDIELDFTETDSQVPTAFNMPTCGKPRHNYLVVALVSYLRTLDREIPYNSGLVRPVQCRTTLGSLLHPEPGAAVGVRAVTMHRVSDTVMGCLAQATPEVVPAAGSGGGTIVLLSVDTLSGRRVSVVEPVTGGSGARTKKDGINGCDIVGGASRNIPVEVLEEELPVLVHRYGLRPSSGGAGQFRGGLGTEFAFELMATIAKVTARGIERRRFRPWGRQGGRPGAKARVRLIRGDGQERDEPRLDVVEMKRGDVLSFSAAGGGGLGDPMQREADVVLQDVMDEYISADDAEREYGVVIRNGKVDKVATQDLRLGRTRQDGEDEAMFDFGPERAEYEAHWPPEILASLRTGLSHLPGALRFYVQEQLLSQWQTAHLSGIDVEPSVLLRAAPEGAGVSSRDNPAEQGVSTSDNDNSGDSSFS